MWYENKDVDKTLDEAWGSTTPEGRATALGKIQDILMEDNPWIWLYYPDVVVGTRTNVHGVEPLPMTIMNLRFAWKS